jgi:hypothetical protein
MQFSLSLYFLALWLCIKTADSRMCTKASPNTRESKKFQRLFKMRTAVERVNRCVKGLLGMNLITVKRIDKVTIRSALRLLIILAAAVGTADHPIS